MFIFQDTVPYALGSPIPPSQFPLKSTDLNICVCVCVYLSNSGVYFSLKRHNGFSVFNLNGMEGEYHWGKTKVWNWLLQIPYKWVKFVTGFMALGCHFHYFLQIPLTPTFRCPDISVQLAPAVGVDLMHTKKDSSLWWPWRCHFFKKKAFWKK